MLYFKKIYNLKEKYHILPIYINEISINPSNMTDQFLLSMKKINKEAEKKTKKISRIFK